MMRSSGSYWVHCAVLQRRWEPCELRHITTYSDYYCCYYLFFNILNTIVIVINLLVRILALTLVTVSDFGSYPCYHLYHCQHFYEDSDYAQMCRAGVVLKLSV